MNFISEHFHLALISIWILLKKSSDIVWQTSLSEVYLLRRDFNYKRVGRLLCVFVVIFAQLFWFKIKWNLFIVFF